MPYSLANGRSRGYINGRLASAAELVELAAGLADISSQHEHHTLVRVSGDAVRQGDGGGDRSRRLLRPVRPLARGAAADDG